MSNAIACNIKFTILGSGTSAGIPIIGCNCDVCTSDDPRDKRLRPSACLEFTDATDQQRVILIDTSPDLREQALRHKLCRCDGIVYTHNHVDHTFGLDEVRRFNALMQQPITVYAETHTFEHLYRVYRHVFEKEKNVNDSFVATLIAEVIEPDRPIDLFGLRFTPLRFFHGRLPILGFRIEALDDHGQITETQPPPLPLAYCTDVSSVPPETWPKLTGLSTLILDMLRYRKHPTHMSVDQAIEAATSIEAQQTYFIHMTHDICHADLEEKLPDRMALSYDGLVID